MAEKRVNGLSLAAIGVGLTFVYAGVKGHSITASFQNLITGKSPTKVPQTTGIDSPSEGGSQDFGGGDLGKGGSPDQNRALGKLMAAQYGWTGSQWDALETLWTGESGWRTDADNPNSDAYGIPQALPGSKMASAGSDWKTNPATQIKWGLGYIKSRYGSPRAALNAWNSRNPHWY
jgi:hypothetical protein